MTFQVVEIIRAYMPTENKGDEGFLTWGQTYAVADTFDEADEKRIQIASGHQGEEPLTLAIYDTTEGVLSVAKEDS